MESIDNETQRLIELCARIKRAKEALEVNGVCPEMDMNHEEDPYNIGFIWASLKNALHSATDSLKSIVVCKEPGNLQEIIEKSDIVQQPKKEETENP